MPLWLAPIQATVMTITDRQQAYAGTVAQALAGAGLRVATDLRNEKITYKIREHSLQKLPYHLILGDKEEQQQTVAVRTRAGEDLGAMSLAALLSRLQAEVAGKIH
jgi:threonyl-tRNA synthetase